MNQNPPKPKIKQLNFKVQEDFYWKLKNFASSKRIKMLEVLEKAFKFYEKREQIINEINTYRQTIQKIEEQMQFFQGKMNWKELELKIVREGIKKGEERQKRQQKRVELYKWLNK